MVGFEPTWWLFQLEYGQYPIPTRYLPRTSTVPSHNHKIGGFFPSVTHYDSEISPPYHYRRELPLDV